MSRGLPYQVKTCLDKALDSALLAVETYNKPATKFKSGGYIVLMTIAWTALFHAIFFKNNTKPFYRKKNSRRFKKVDGEYWYWELQTCVDEYFNGTTTAIKKNIEFFIPLRNKLEHKSLPEIDADIFAECQSFLLNFDKIVEKEFGPSYCLRESLSFALQLFSFRDGLRAAVAGSSKAKNVKEFIQQYRSAISPEIWQSGEYSFKAFLIQVANHSTDDAMPIQFIAYDKLNNDEKNRVSKIAALVKEKHIIHTIANHGTLKPGTVVKKVQEALGNPQIIKNGKPFNKFNLDTHTRFWRKYEIRPKGKSKTPERTKVEFCIYDEPCEQYFYTEKWVSFLIDKMQNDDAYDSLYDITPIDKKSSITSENCAH